MSWRCALLAFAGVVLQDSFANKFGPRGEHHVVLQRRSGTVLCEGLWQKTNDIYASCPGVTGNWNATICSMSCITTFYDLLIPAVGAYEAC
jgi:hypothetical protein